MADDPIQTHHVFPPIPMRQFDWCAYRDPESKLVGWGRTEAEALADFDRLEKEAYCSDVCEAVYTMYCPLVGGCCVPENDPVGA